ncbi:patatin-like phospholipase family protein [Polymorphum gilvum]|uniref:Phospholipase, patatin family n=1 Tax=Polymorphum gilvum (strain LMG 25793 / CGMCC 1.9160 / SL003B-26A1) TaxID=991905 RepID=F2J3L3_POLGS|nr:patatin-like phospholipase family protein [Polymorphum gilvum]ADZ72149.1 Phospholipase, patatin family [Polymorphum gilvum SL003B-26A1]
MEGAGKRIVLSIDGGGMRGLIPLRILESLESRLAQRGLARPLHRVFDLMAGTSTGGLIAAGLAAPRPSGGRSEAAATVAELRALFETEAREIFQPRLRTRLVRLIGNPLRPADERLDARPFERHLKERFGWTSMASSLTRLLLTAYDIGNRRPLFLGAGQPDGSPADDYYLWQAVRATTAVPAFFEPARVENLSQKREEALIDGGVFLNDPTLAAYGEARRLGWAAEDLVIVSLGTGFAPSRGFAFEDAVQWDGGAWMRASRGAPLQAIATHAQSAAGSLLAGRLFSDLGGVTYHRFDGEIPAEAEDMGNARPGNMLVLNGAADRILRDNTLRLDALADLIVAVHARRTPAGLERAA